MTRRLIFLASADMLGVRYVELIPVLIGAIQDQQRQIRSLQAQVDALSATNLARDR